MRDYDRGGGGGGGGGEGLVLRDITVCGKELNCYSGVWPLY